MREIKNENINCDLFALLLFWWSGVSCFLFFLFFVVVAVFLDSQETHGASRLDWLSLAVDGMSV